MLRAIYEKKKIEVKKELPGIFKFIDWLPCDDSYVNISGRPIAYKSEGLANYLGLSNLWIIYSGYWPAKGSDLVTRTFKQLEAPSTMVRYLNSTDKPMPLIVSSAGNTANAFNYVTNELGIPLYIIVPKSGLRKLRLPVETNPTLILVDGDYSDAIEIADGVADKTGLFREGGARNVARRDGMGIAMLEAVTTSEHLFDHYFQAVGSGTGGIAAWESVLRLIEDGSYGSTKTKLHLAQNLPFTPMVDSWNNKSRSLNIVEDEAKKQISSVTAPVLTNRHPPYSVCGGVFDALSDTNGHMYGISNIELFDAARIFRTTEGNDIGPAGSVATSALMRAINKKIVNKDDKIVLHITGGGFDAQLKRFGSTIHVPKPAGIVNPGDVERVLSIIGKVNPIGVNKDLLRSV